MSNRERWIIYPLLFLALGAALRTRLLPSFTNLEAETAVIDRLQSANFTELKGQRIEVDGLICDRLQVNSSLVVVAPDGKPRLVLTTGEHGDHTEGELFLLGEEGQFLAALRTNQSGAGLIQLNDAEGSVRMFATESLGGGALVTMGGDQQPLVALEHNMQGDGAVVRYKDGKRYAMMARLIDDVMPLQAPPVTPLPDTGAEGEDDAGEVGGEEATDTDASGDVPSEDPADADS